MPRVGVLRTAAVAGEVEGDIVGGDFIWLWLGHHTRAPANAEMTSSIPDNGKEVFPLGFQASVALPSLPRSQHLVSP